MEVRAFNSHRKGNKMKIKFVQDCRFGKTNAAGYEKLVDYYAGTIDNVDVVAKGSNSVLTFSNGETAELGNDCFEIVQELPLTNSTETV